MRSWRSCHVFLRRPSCLPFVLHCDGRQGRCRGGFSLVWMEDAREAAWSYAGATLLLLLMLCFFTCGSVGGRCVPVFGKRDETPVAISMHHRLQRITHIHSSAPPPPHFPNTTTPAVITPEFPAHGRQELPPRSPSASVAVRAKSRAQVFELSTSPPQARCRSSGCRGIFFAHDVRVLVGCVDRGVRGRIYLRCVCRG